MAALGNPVAGEAGRARDLPVRAAALWHGLNTSRVPPLLWLVALWFVLVVPLIFLRAAHFEDGTGIALARGAVEDGHWLVPYQYGDRFHERPVLLSFLIALINWPLGRVDPVLARVPTVLALLAGGVMLFWFVRRYASAAAALFAAACFFVSPMILQRLVTAEPDLLLSVILLGAFIVWWIGFETDRSTPARWLVIGLLVGIAGLAKGPQPCAYFFLGVGAFLLLHRRWGDLVGLTAAGVVAGVVVFSWYLAVYQPGDEVRWRSHSRIGLHVPWGEHLRDGSRFVGGVLIESLPACLLLVPLAIDSRFRSEVGRDRTLVQALLFYAICCTLVLVLWPGTRPRYAMPGILALAAAAGLMFDRARIEWPRLQGVAVMIALGLGLFQILLNWVAMPLAPDLGGVMRKAGNTIASTIHSQPAILYVPLERSPKNPLIYVPPPIRLLPMDRIVGVSAPAWVLLTNAELERLKAERPELRITSVTPVEQIGRILVRLSD
jgi:4-amino-4-deoxy-L-arabinose transferase-like glycosyltransferase